MYKLKRLFTYCKVLFITVAAEVAGIFFRHNKDYKDLWVVSERGVDARDNAYHFFSFLRNVHPEINAVYVISKKSPDFQKVASMGKTVEYGSFKHYLCYLLASYRISTHIDGYSPDILFFHKFGKFFPDKSKKVFLQHGIISNDLAFCHANQTDIDLFICTAVPEYEFIKENFGYPEGVLQLAGLCRYDKLKKTENLTRKILFMPTWRSDLRTCSRRKFLQSEYFLTYNAFLNSRHLIELLEKYDYELIFYPHYEIQRFLDCFHTSSERVKIADFQNSDVQELLIGSDVLVTDYSSVFFDFAYMRKPIVYFHYNDAAFRAGHYKEGYFHIASDGFGEIALTEEEVVKCLERVLENGAQPASVYLERMNAFFKFDDTDNCKRNYEAIRRLR